GYRTRGGLAIFGYGNVGRGGVHGIASGDDVRRERRIIDGATEHADLVERRRERDEAKPADASVRGLHTDDAAERRRLPHRPTGLGSERDRHDARGDSGGGSAGRTARHARTIHRIQRWPERA